MTYRALAALVFITAILYGSYQPIRRTEPIHPHHPRPCMACPGID